MLNFSHQTRVFLFLQPVDMRKSFRGLCQLAESVLKQNPASGHWFAFINRRRDRLKLLGWDAQLRQQQTAIDSLRRDLALMKRTLFGQRRERFEDPHQGLLFDSEILAGTQPQKNSEPPTAADKKSSSKGKGRGRRILHADGHLSPLAD